MPKTTEPSAEQRLETAKADYESAKKRYCDQFFANAQRIVPSEAKANADEFERAAKELADAEYAAQVADVDAKRKQAERDVVEKRPGVEARLKAAEKRRDEHWIAYQQAERERAEINAALITLDSAISTLQSRAETLEGKLREIKVPSALDELIRFVIEDQGVRKEADPDKRRYGFGDCLNLVDQDGSARFMTMFQRIVGCGAWPSREAESRISHLLKGVTFSGNAVRGGSGIQMLGSVIEP